ncbi:MAG: Maf family protein [Bacteroidota bacterium]
MKGGEEELILASTSPRRAALLRKLGIPFRVEPSDYSEQAGNRPGDPARLVEELAAGKAKEVSARLGRGLVLGADTVVALSGAVLEKPSDPEDARRMLAALSGRWHEVHTGLALIRADIMEVRTAHERTRVKFRTLLPGEIDAYVRTGEPMDKAGAYGIQGLGAALVERVDGCYTNVVGLPLACLISLLREGGIRVLGV